MLKHRDVTIVLTIAALGFAPACAPGPIELKATGAASTVAVDESGGVITVVAGAHTLLLDVPAGALTERVDITVEPVELTDVPGAPAARFSPDGLVFALAATLHVTPPPPGEVLIGVTFDDGDVLGELVFVAPGEDGSVSIPIEHFSGAVVASREQLRTRLSDDDRALVDAVEDATESAALGLGDRMRRVVEPAIAAAAGSTSKLRVAAAAFVSWQAAIQLLAVEEELTSIRGSETFADALTRLSETLATQGQSLLAAFQSPACSDPGGEVQVLNDWLRVRVDIIALLQEIGVETPASEPCVQAEIVIDADPVLSEADASLSADVELQLVGPGDERESLGPTTFTFDVTGALDPGDIESATGSVAAIRFTRPSTQERPRAIVITVAATLDAALRAAGVSVSPLVFVASEPLAAAAVVAPQTLNLDETAQVCVTATASGEAVQRFSATFSATLGAIDAASVTTTGQSCVAYRAPASNEGPSSVISIVVTVDGAQVSTSTVVALSLSPEPVLDNVTRDSSSGQVSVSLSTFSDCPEPSLRSPDGATEWTDTLSCVGEGGESGTATMSFTESYAGSELVAVTVSSSSSATDGAAASGEYILQFAVAQTTQLSLVAEVTGGANSGLLFQFFTPSGVAIDDRDGGLVEETLTLVPGQYTAIISAVSGGIPSSGGVSFSLNLTFGP